MMSLNKMRIEASECNDTFLKGDFKTPYELFLSLIKDRENKIKKAREDIMKEIEYILEGMHGTAVENEFCIHTLLEFEKEIKKLKGEK